MRFMRIIKRFLEEKDVVNKLKDRHRLYQQLSPYRWECPSCTAKAWRGDPYSASVSVKHLWDEQYHKYKFYFGCRHCNYVTPAYETAREAYVAYTENMISVEHEETTKMF